MPQDDETKKKETRDDDEDSSVPARTAPSESDSSDSVGGDDETPERAEDDEKDWEDEAEDDETVRAAAKAKSEAEGEAEDDETVRAAAKAKSEAKGAAAKAEAKRAAPKSVAKDDDDAETEGEGDDEPETEGKGDDEEEARPDEAAARVARALGVDDEGDAAEDDGEAAAPTNRAARRREEALERRRKRKGGSASSSAAARRSAEEDLPKDRNARAKDLLKKRRDQASDRQRGVSSALLPGEMVDDALARTVSATGKWFKSNWSIIQWVIVAAIVVGGGLGVYRWRSEKKEGVASGGLSAALAAERGRVMAEDKRSEEEKEVDVTKVFKSPEERTDTVLAGYNKVIDEHPGTAAAILAKLGQAGAYLDKSDYPHALESYQAVLSSPLATADTDVRARALEGAGFAKEGTRDFDGALGFFKQLEGIDTKGFKELGQYHQARIHLAKGDKDKAKELLKAAREKLQQPSTDGKPFPFLEAVVDETLRKIDPSAVPPRSQQQLGGPKGAMTQEQLEKLLKKAREGAEKKGGEDPH